MRLDKWVAAQFDSLSRSRIKALIESGCLVIMADEARQTIAEPDRPVKPGDVFEITVPPAPTAMSGSRRPTST
jgi:23S rRNA pseudouridine1911/1915/1917 synthase